MPGIQIIVGAMLASLPELGTVMILLSFIFAIFSILGMQLFLGMQHSRCRVTPYPVDVSFATAPEGARWADHRCYFPNGNLVDGSTLCDNELKCVHPDDSRWVEPLDDCYWPLDKEETRICALPNAAAWRELPGLMREGVSFSWATLQGWRGVGSADPSLNQALTAARAKALGAHRAART